MIAKPSKKHRKSLADTLSAIAWSTAVRLESGLDHREIETLFMPECVKRINGKLSRPRLSDRYATGVLTPKLGKPKCGGLQFVDRVDTCYQGTAKWLHHPLWELLQPKIYSLGELHMIMARLEGKIVRGLFFVENDLTNKTLVRNYNVEPKVIRKLWKHSSLDNFALLLGLLREAEIRTDMPSHHCACQAMLLMLPQIAKLNPIESIAGLLFDDLQQRFFNVIYTDPSGNEMIATNAWREMYPRLAEVHPETISVQCKSERRYLLSPVKIEI